MTIKTKFQSGDGETHDTKAAAERRNKLREANKKLKEACDTIKLLIGEQAMTADGVPFDPRRWRDYWRVLVYWGQKPCVRKVNLYPHTCEIDFEYATEMLVVREFSEGKYVTHRINDLYSTEHAANAACVKALRELAKEIEENIGALET